MTWHRDLAKNLRKFRRTVPDSEPGFLLYAGDLSTTDEGCAIRHFRETGYCLT
ncbi:MAG: hypothetical protein GVY36_16830 [Verrucomicrobia bacterium]|jgi:hypothetical protein|nr:hypothetical protein [Verrucomicrobiota bacterium]